MTSAENDYFDIGAIVNVHGLRGEIRVMPSTDDPRRFELLKMVEIFFKTGEACLEMPSRGESMKYPSSKFPLEKVRPHKSMLVLKLRGVEDRNAAEALVGGVIKVPRSEALPLDEDEYYQKDLLEMAVVTDTGEELGRLMQIIETGANDVYVIRPAEDAGGKIKDILIPAIKECILSVDLPGKLMTVHLMKGLREL